MSILTLTKIFMINYSCKTFRAACLTVLSAVVLLTSSCTEVDDHLGSNLIPDDQQMTFGVISTYEAVTTSTYFTDSIMTSNVGILMMGQEESPIYGTTTASFVTQYSPYYHYSEDSDYDYDDDAIFGIDPIFDSMYITMAIYQAFEGDTTVTQSFSIHEVIKDLYYDSVYYANFDYSEYIDPEPITTFSFAGTLADDNLVIAMPKSFGEKLFDSSGGEYEEDTVFLEKFKGLAFIRNDDSPSGAIYASLGSTAVMELYYRNHDEYGAIQDSSYAIYHFDDSYYTYNVSVNSIKHDYTNSEIVLDSVSAQAITHVQGIGGVATKLEFNSDFVDELKALVGPDKEYSMIAINKAEIVFKTRYKYAVDNEYSPGQLGMYENYINLTTTTDYNYEYESAGYTIPYGGYLEQSLGQYTMDITSQFSDLVADDEDAVSRVILGTTYTSQTQFQQVELMGSASSEPPYLTVTYTLIK